MHENDWWHRQLRMIQYNLQMKDTPRMDAEKIARETEEMGGNAVIINVADSVVWYTTAVHFQKINPYLPQDRDLLKELIDAFHKRNIKVFARGAFMGFEEEVYYQKPQWAKRNFDGSPVMLGNERPGEWYRLYSPCPNSGFVSDSGLNVAAEAFKKYDLDGAFWLSPNSVTAGNCWCDHCKSLYYETFGEEMPTDPAKLDPKWDDALRRKMQIRTMEAVLKVKPDMPYLRYYWPFDLDIGVGFKIPADNIDEIAQMGNTLCTEAQDVLSLGVLKLPEWNTPALRMKMGRTIENYPPPVGIIHACPGMDWRHACMPEAEFLYWASQIPANGGSFWTTFTGFADTIPDKRMLKTIGKLNRMIEKIEDDMFGAKSDCQVMLLSDGSVFTHGWAEALMCAHIDYDMLAQYQLVYERIKDYPVVIAPKNIKYTDENKQIFLDYVKNGGKLIVEGTQAMPLRPIRELLGVDGVITCSEDLEATYLRIEPADSGIQEKIGDCDLVPLRGKIGYSEAKETSKVLATWVPAFSSTATAGFPPERASLPKPHTEIPLCVVSEHGAGKVMFLPYEPSRMIREYGLKDMFTMIEGYVDYMLDDDRRMVVHAPGRVMTTVFRKENKQMIHFVNGIGQRPLQDTIPCCDLSVSLKLSGKQVESVISKISGTDVSFHVKDDTLSVHLSKLDVWDMLLITYKG